MIIVGKIHIESYLNTITNDIEYLWWGWQDLNLRPIGYEPTALTPELHPLHKYSIIKDLRNRVNSDIV